jgi:hypothetical protein
MTVTKREGDDSHDSLQKPLKRTVSYSTYQDSC